MHHHPPGRAPPSACEQPEREVALRGAGAPPAQLSAILLLHRRCWLQLRAEGEPEGGKAGEVEAPPLPTCSSLAAASRLALPCPSAAARVRTQASFARKRLVPARATVRNSRGRPAGAPGRPAVAAYLDPGVNLFLLLLRCLLLWLKSHVARRRRPSHPRIHVGYRGPLVQNPRLCSGGAKAAASLQRSQRAFRCCGGGGGCLGLRGGNAAHGSVRKRTAGRQDARWAPGMLLLAVSYPFLPLCLPLTRPPTPTPRAAFAGWLIRSARLGSERLFCLRPPWRRLLCLSLFLPKAEGAEIRGQASVQSPPSGSCLARNKAGWAPGCSRRRRSTAARAFFCAVAGRQSPTHGPSSSKAKP